jgi:hypothetical protein
MCSMMCGKMDQLTNSVFNLVDKHSLADLLGVPLLEARSEHSYWGTKQGSREVFKMCGLPFPQGTPDAGDDDLLTESNGVEHSWPAIRTPAALAKGLARQIVCHANPSSQFVCKLNLGFSGRGNAIVSPRATALSRVFARTKRADSP